MQTASQGKGIDRHLLALQCMLKPSDPVPELFSDPVFTASRSFGLSTSNMSPGTRFYGGFGPPSAGFGVNYAIDRDSLRASISGKKSAGMDVYEFKRTLERSLVDMMILFPKRSEVWGMDWREKQTQEGKETAYMTSMKKASKLYESRRDALHKKYVVNGKKE